MGISKIFGRGFGTTNKKARMILYLWLVNFLFCLIIVAPVWFLLSRDFSRSLFEERLVKGFDLIWLADLIYKHQDVFPALFGWLLIPAILFLFFSILLSGGIMGRICAEEEKVNLSNFLADCAKYFSRFFRVFLISLIGYVIVLGVIFIIIGKLFKLWTDKASTEWPLIISSNLKFLIFILLFTIVRMFFDYVKLTLVMEKSKKAIKATVSTFRFMGKNFLRAWLLYLLVGLVFVVFGLIYLGLERILPKAGLLLLIVFVWQQLYIFSRMWTKILFFSTEYHLLWLRKTP